MEYKMIRAEKEDFIGTITLNRPEKKNVLLEEVRLELLRAFSEFEVDKEVKAIIFTGGPDIFAAGANIRAMVDATAMEMFYRKRLPELCEKIERIPKPVIAAIGGYCIGGGSELVLACDMRIAATNLKMGQTEINIGIIPGAGGIVRLVRAIGKAKTKELVYTGKLIGAEEALNIGLVNQVVPPSSLIDEARRLAKQCTRHSTVCLAMAKTAIDAGAEIDLNSAHSLEALAFCMTFSSEDQKEGMRAFLEKRKPQYKS